MTDDVRPEIAGETFEPIEQDNPGRVRELSKRIGRAVVRTGAILGVSLLATTFIGNPEKETDNLDIEFGINYGMPDQSTTAEIPALGGAVIGTHRSPIGVRVEATRVNIDGILNSMSKDDGLEQTVVQLYDATKEGEIELIRNKTLVFLGFLGGSVLVGAGIEARKNKEFKNSLKRWGVAGTFAIAAPLTAGAWTYSTYNENPKIEYYGGFSELSDFASDMNELKNRYETNRDQLAKLVANPMRYIQNIDKTPVLPSDSTVVVLAGDQHSQLGVYDLVNSLVTQFDTDAVVSVGDEVDQGIEPENHLLAEISNIDAPYLVVFGNHDGTENRDFIAGLDNTEVLDEDLQTIDDLKITGIDDPRFTPSENRTLNDNEPSTDAVDKEELLPADQKLLDYLDSLPEEDLPNILVVHDKRAAEKTLEKYGGKIPYLFVGHTHKEKVSEENGTIIVNPGSTGGSSYRAFEKLDDPDHQTAKVLFFDKKTGKLTDILNFDWGPVNELGLKVTHCKPLEDIEKCNE